MADKEFYKDGLRFECTGCGDCCKTHGDYAYVYLTDANVDEISAHLGETVIDFLNKYCQNDKYGSVHLTMVNGNCNFLKDKKCMVYPVRPTQCQAWPFWNENLDAENWCGPVKECCPGIDKGRLRSKEEIEEIARNRDKAYGIDF